MNIYFKDRDGSTPLDPNLKGLKNKLITTMGELDILEETNIALGLLWLENYSQKEFYSTKFLLELHKHLFNDVWNWAGKIRNIELANTKFSPFYRVREDLLNLERDVQTWLDHKSFKEDEIAARYHHRLILIHPFNNGNGRTTRIACEFFCKKLSFKIPTWSKSLEAKSRRENYLKALRAMDEQDDANLLINFMFTE